MIIHLTTTLLHLFNGLFSRTSWLSQPRKMNHSGFYWSKRWWGGSGISWTICISFAPCSRQTTMPVPHHSDFYKPDALPAAQPTTSKHWRQYNNTSKMMKYLSVMCSLHLVTWTCLCAMWHFFYSTDAFLSRLIINLLNDILCSTAYFAPANFILFYGHLWYFSLTALTLLAGYQEEHPSCKNDWWGAGKIICLEWGANGLHMV